MSDEKKHVEMMVPNRNGFTGTWALGKHWLPGRHLVEVDEKGLEELMQLAGAKILGFAEVKPELKHPEPSRPQPKQEQAKK